MGTKIEVTIPQESLPPLSMTRANYNPEIEKARYAMNKQLIATKYHYEKFVGKRKESGALKLNELKPEHKQYVAAFINGMKGVEIAEQYNVAAITVYRVLADPLAQAMIGEFDDGFKADFRAMFPIVSDAIRDSLDSGNETIRLKAVDRWAKISRLIDGDAEDDSGNKVEQIFSARARFVSMVKDITDRPGLVEMEAEMVEVKS